MAEIWKHVPSVEGLEASSLGRVRCISYAQPMPYGGQRIRALSPTKGVVSYGSKGSTYRRLIFRFRGKTYKVSRVVCEAFHGPAPVGKNVVLHLDEDSFNNLPDNLAWGTQRENLNAPRFRAERHVRRAA